MFGPEGKPVTVSAGRLFGCAPWAFSLNQFHQLYLTPYVSWGILLLVFVLVLHYTGQGPKVADFYNAPREIQRFSLAERWTHLMRLITFLVLFLTGYIFFYNNVTMLRLFFGSPNAAVIFHWVAGLIFVAAGSNLRLGGAPLLSPELQAGIVGALLLTTIAGPLGLNLALRRTP